MQSGGSLSRSGRHWIRAESIVRPFAWNGLLPLLGLLLLSWFALGPFAHRDIEQQVAHETRQLLAASGMGWAQVAVSGQGVHLSGAEPAAGDGDKALALARGTRCPTWAGLLACPIVVDGRFEAGVAAPAAPVADAQARAACEKSLADIVAGRHIEFATASAVLKPGSAGLLDALAQAAAQCPGVIRIEGHSDSVGNADRNRALSEARAGAVRAALVSRGVAQARLQALGHGADQPIADNVTARGREANRRIEFHVVAE